jgi:ABC-type nickel/cobalt efflux system permease component RcnA
MLEGKNLSFKEAWSAVLAVGVRPCTGAIVVLSFAFLNSLYLAGVTAVLAMSIGTGITVAIIAIIAVTAKNTAVRIAGAQDSLGTIHRVIEISGAALVFLLGFLLFTAALTV